MVDKDMYKYKLHRFSFILIACSAVNTISPPPQYFSQLKIQIKLAIIVPSVFRAFKFSWGFFFFGLIPLFQASHLQFLFP